MKIIYIVETRMGGKGKWESDFFAFSTLKYAKEDVADCKSEDSYLNDGLEYRIRRAILEDVKDAIFP